MPIFRALSFVLNFIILPINRHCYFINSYDHTLSSIVTLNFLATPLHPSIPCAKAMDRVGCKSNSSYILSGLDRGCMLN